MASKEEMRSQLSGVGVAYTDEILETCCNFCERNNIDEVSFVDSWVAFAFSELSGDLKITKESLQLLERRKFDSKVLTTPKQGRSSIVAAKKNSHQNITPNRKRILQHHVSSPNEGLTFSPTSYSPTVNREKRESNIPSGHVLLSCGHSSTSWKASHSYVSKVKILHSKDKKSWKFMYDVLCDIWNLLEDFCEELSGRIIAINDLSHPAQFSISLGENLVFVGRVSAEESRINSQCVEIQGIGDSFQENLFVDMSQLVEYSLFPGQVVAFKGFWEGKKVIATQLYISAKGALSDSPHIKETLQLVIAAGPFAGPDQQGCEVFNSIIKYLQERQPNYFILIGPVLDSTNQEIFISDFAETFVDYHHRVLSQIADSLKGLPTKFFFMSSPKDVVSLPVYPTPPLSYTNDFTDSITLLSDPSLIDVDGLIIGVTSVDTLFHLSKKEVSNCKGNRLARLASHLINQQTFYPLFPSDLDIGIDFNLWDKFTRMPTVPHILLLPSDLHFFMKSVENCLVINPERIIKGYTRGSFAHIEVTPQNEETPWSIDSNISVRIIKV